MINTNSYYCYWCGIERDMSEEGYYCSPQHRDRANNSRYKRNRSMRKASNTRCRTPQKVSYPNRGAAIRAAYRFEQLYYTCRCGNYHLTSQQPCTSEQRDAAAAVASFRATRKRSVG